METFEKTNNKHLGRKITRIRELRGMKQEALAVELGISQQAISKLEQSAEIEDATIEKIAVVLGVTAEGLKNFTEEAIINNINSFYDSSSFNLKCVFNPLDKLMEVIDKNEKLYERLLASEKEKIELLRQK
ncbi:MAG: XRE family transcriptional regulator [Flavobacterium sp.]|nr:MAG: XRE family transcriptional regulator [Flavobacterium sp.]